ncbi:hypothetical protein TNCT_331031 [Trichonephila clavata]|uniref:Uncharacterized protein n=1 Tax=Trichonephila clavata TaxID=2740835 RepID=A0A8X6KKR5_TRICU|nr:hypothetical protein TNCT_331031 [Trichonephila clavata]
MQDPTQPLWRCRSKERDKRWCQRVKNSVSNPELCCMTGITDCMRADLTLMSEISNRTRLEIRDLTKPLLVYTYEKEEIRRRGSVSKKKFYIISEICCTDRNNRNQALRPHDEYNV